jgi:hypothetical protein
MSSTSRNFAAILLLLLVAVELGGGSLLTLLTRCIPGFLDNPLRQNMWRAGHAHPGVWPVLGLPGCSMSTQGRGPRSEVAGSGDAAGGADPGVARVFLSVLSPNAERPSGLINLIYLAGLVRAVGVVTLGIGLFQA